MSTLHTNTVETSSGGAVTLTKQEAVKVRYTASYSGGSPTLEQGTGVSSFADNGTGLLQVNFITSFSDAQFSCVHGSQQAVSNNATETVAARTTSLMQHNHYESGATLTDPVHMTGAMFGDLA